MSPPPLSGWSRLATAIASQSLFFMAVSPYSLPISLSRLSAFIPPPHRVPIILPTVLHSHRHQGWNWWGLGSPALFQGSGTVGHSRCATSPPVIMRNGENPHVLGQGSPWAGGFAGCPWWGMGLNNSLPAAPPHPRLQGGTWTDTCTTT